LPDIQNVETAMRRIVFPFLLVLLIGVAGFMLIQNVSSPKLGVESGQLKPLSSRPNAVSTQAKSESKRVAAIAFKGSADQYLAKVAAVIDGMPGAEIKQKEGAYLYAVFTTPLMRFRDDVEIFLDDTAQELHFRSASRVGYSDMGANKKRYHAFASALAGVE
jgi:uncharacterized protein (DUF1499 family)